MLVAHGVALLCANVSHALCVLLATAYTRCLAAVAHLYLGEGLHPLLRVTLGLVECLSTLFRAVSLSLRTVCNGVAGHVLLAVLLEMTAGTELVLHQASYYLSQCCSST